MSWSSAQTKLDALPLHTPDLNDRSSPHPIDQLADSYANEPIQTNADAAAAIILGLAAMGLDVEENGPGERLIRNAIAYLKMGVAAPEPFVLLAAASVAVVMLSANRFDEVLSPMATWL